MSGRKIARTAGLGTWDGQSKDKDILNDSGEVNIGSMKMLNFVLNSGSEAVKSGWIMHEYSLHAEEEVQESVRCLEKPTSPEIRISKRQKPRFEQEDSQPTKILKTNNNENMAIVSAADGTIDELRNLANIDEVQIISPQVLAYIIHKGQVTSPSTLDREGK
ncbi:hypothetical protein ACH5RR_030016 [Cinchona calisaya]|uniref:NAC domain-containing protein n=1 Tax=Cinchona calisaya TaxID=153742 RepID=A0ABD2YWX7_9GENT